MAVNAPQAAPQAQGNPWQAMMWLMDRFLPPRPEPPNMANLGFNALAGPFMPGSPMSLGSQLNNLYGPQGVGTMMNLANQQASLANKQFNVAPTVAAINSGPAYAQAGVGLARNNLLSQLIPGLTNALGNFGKGFGEDEAPDVEVKRGPLAPGEDVAEKGRKQREAKRKIRTEFA